MEAREGRFLFRAPIRASVGGKGFMCMHTAFDARNLLPPFGPAGVNEDGLWASVLGYLQRESVIAYPIQAVFHDPPEPRVRGSGDLSRSGFLLNEVLNAVLGLSASRLESGPAAYATLGRRIAALAGGRRPALRQALAESIARVIGTRIGILERALDEYGDEPANWAADVGEAIASLASKLEEPSFWLPAELSGLEPSAAEDALADYIFRFGELLQAWPAIFEEARRIGPELLESARLPGPH